jgi:small-conductance mechanosensitive channel
MIIIIAFVLSKLGGVIVEQAIRPRSPALAVRARGVVAGAVVVIGLLLAMKQMGLETDVLMIVVAGVVATATLAGGLGIGLGSQPLARQIAAGRHVEDRFTIGQVVRVGDLAGRISSIDMASVTLVDEAGRAWVVPHLSFLDNAVETSPD